MIETLKSIVFVVVTVMVALILQAHAGMLQSAEADTSDTAPTQQLQVFN